jgi:hypothetical protein
LVAQTSLFQAEVNLDAPSGPIRTKITLRGGGWLYVFHVGQDRGFPT